MSCNGCRVLRKGCSSHCALRPCLRWIHSPESQANATLFLARFYGRAGLLNLIDTVDAHLRSEIFRSLLYDACGRIVNPVYGSVGLLSSGDWSRCQAAVDAVLRGAAIEMPGSDAAALRINGDIRHFSKNFAGCRSRSFRNRFKRSGSRRRRLDSAVTMSGPRFTITGWDCGGDCKDFIVKRALSHDSGSVATVEPALLNPVCGEPQIGLDLSLGPTPVRPAYGCTVIEI